MVSEIIQNAFLSSAQIRVVAGVARQSGGYRHIVTIRQHACEFEIIEAEPRQRLSVGAGKRICRFNQELDDGIPDSQILRQCMAFLQDRAQTNHSFPLV